MGNCFTNEKMKNIYHIVACDVNNHYAIGNKNDLLYYFSKDLKHFKDMTKNNVILMGRKTFESLPNILPNRKHLVISRNKEHKTNNVLFFPSIANAVYYFHHFEKEKKLFIIGGEEIFKQTFNIIDGIYMTEIYGQDICYDKIYPWNQKKFKKKTIIQSKFSDLDKKSQKMFDIQICFFEK